MLKILLTSYFGGDGLVNRMEEDDVKENRPRVHVRVTPLVKALNEGKIPDGVLRNFAGQVPRHSNKAFLDALEGSLALRRTDIATLEEIRAQVIGGEL